MARRRRARLRGWMPNRVAARFISGGKHQTFKSIAKAPLRTRTITNKNNRRQQYQAAKRRDARTAAAEKRTAAREAAAQRKAYARRAAELKRLAPHAPRKARPKKPPIAVDPRTGKAITWAQAVKALREAGERAERLAAGLPGDAPAKPGRPRSAKSPPARPATRRAAPRAQRPLRPQSTPRKKQPIPAPAAPGKTLTGVYYAATCACQGTGRIVQYRSDGTPDGSISCPRHGRKARGQRKFTARRAIADAGLPGLASWLDGKTRRGRGNLDKKQQRAAGRAERKARVAGPTAPCGACAEGIVNRELTDDLRMAHVSDLIAKYEGMGRRVPSSRQLDAMARRAYPYDHCRECGGLGQIPKASAGDWYERAPLKDRHRLTPRERAAGHVDPARTRGPRTRRS